MADQYEVIIIGGGPGGLTAGLYCGRARLKTLLLEKGVMGGQIITSNQVEDYPGFDLITGADLIERMEQQARKTGIEIQTRTVSGVGADGDAFIVETGGGTLRARALIIAAGGSARHLEVPGEQEFSAKGVTYCAICDAPLFRGKTVCVVGGGDSAAEESDVVAKYAQKVYVIHRGERLRSQKILQERMVANPKIAVLFNTVVKRIEGGEVVERIQLQDVKTKQERALACQGVFIAIGFDPNTGFFKMPIAKDARGYLLTDTVMQTSVPGIFAVGDVRSQLCKQVTNSTGDATTAAIAAEKYLNGTLQPAHGSLGLFVQSARGRERAAATAQHKE